MKQKAYLMSLQAKKESVELRDQEFYDKVYGLRLRPISKLAE